ncbi:5-formyltetrahydrofolate cyclo-ligase [Helicocarpus griseus UAMH5409]|uniref:5-formyltetrahydrofolate cyclo-ligase n=1 Tax=Helicocarpus griseus UAMH5409 TaxID=1447875 RepID=A0A2B7WRH7_9EURO|nr:5-formyltetrahydrofolate cyclo-ligase [Helicocarpus griseus UAMH5409]
MATLQTAKKELRSKLRKILSELSKESISVQSSIATRNLLSLPEYEAAKRLSVYLSMPSGEISTAAVVHDAFSKGKQVYVPYLHKTDPSATATQGRSSVMEMLALRSLEDYELLQADKWGIPSLDADSIASRKNCLGGYGVAGTAQPDSTSTGAEVETEAEGSGLDLIVVPGVAFDEQLRRLGHGKGYYDHYINRLTNKRNVEGNATMQKPYLVALALGEQLLPPNEKIPVAGHDWPVDALVIGDGRILTSTS